MKDTKTIPSRSSRNLTWFGEHIYRKRWENTPFLSLYTSLTVIAASRWLSAQAGGISGATIVQNINSSLRSVNLKVVSRGGMFGCIAAHAQIIVVDTQPHMMLNN